MNKPYSIILSSGGLDSTLACHLMKDHPVNNVVLYCINPFDLCSGGCGSKSVASATALKLGYEFRTIEMDDEFLRLVEKPVFGHGKNMNPCIDCRIYMLRKAAEILNSKGEGFVVTGEVSGQRPMSQHKQTLKRIENAADLRGYVLRPLSGRILPATVPEERGWIHREKLNNISGRSRKVQLKLAEKYGLKTGDYLAPGGGCRLTSREYSAKVRDLIANNMYLDMENIILLSRGRHFRIDKDLKVIVGRDEKENNELMKLAPSYSIKMWPQEEVKGPVCIGLGSQIDENKKNIIAGMCGRYSDMPTGAVHVFEYEHKGSSSSIKAAAFDSEAVIKYKI